MLISRLRINCDPFYLDFKPELEYFDEVISSDVFDCWVIIRIVVCISVNLRYN